MLQGVVTYGTGVAAQIPGWPIAGKTGTTENYGDAWFVGFTPDLVTAVWVGYPNTLVPMLTEFHGQPVEGGTYPALIWKAYMQKAFTYLHLTPTDFPPASIPPSSPATVTFGDAFGSMPASTPFQLDNGNCRVSATIDFFDGMAPTSTATCPPHEVNVPNVIGESLATATATITGAPLVPHIRYIPARPGEQLGTVVAETPLGALSSYSNVILTLPRALHGVVPRLVGLSAAQAQSVLAKLRLRFRLVGGSAGTVSMQSPPAGVAAAPGMRETLTLRETGG
jgi:hypothetical protein